MKEEQIGVQFCFLTEVPAVGLNVDDIEANFMSSTAALDGAAESTTENVEDEREGGANPPLPRNCERPA